MLQVGHPCGLFNRVDVIATGYVLAALRGEKEIEVLWPLNDRHMPVRFQDLFSGLPSGRVVEREIDSRVTEEYNAAQASLPADYRRSEVFVGALRELLARIVPEVQSEVSSFIARHFHASSAPGASTIGVHVRRSENPLPLCPYAQPLRYYEAIMRSFAPDTRFFISTDSQEAFSWFRDRFGERVFQREKQHDNRSTTDGVREGLVDMLLLSRCDAIVGTFGSSFSGIAATAGQRPVLMVKALPSIPNGWPRFATWRWLWAYRHFLIESTIWHRWYLWVGRPQLARIPRAPAKAMRMIRSLRSASDHSAPL